jgi:hypothetical protein
MTTLRGGVLLMHFYYVPEILASSLNTPVGWHSFTIDGVFDPSSWRTSYSLVKRYGLKAIVLHGNDRKVNWLTSIPEDVGIYIFASGISGFRDPENVQPRKRHPSLEELKAASVELEGEIRLAESLETSEIAWLDNDSDPHLTLN